MLETQQTPTQVIILKITQAITQRIIQAITQQVQAATLIQQDVKTQHPIAILTHQKTIIATDSGM